MPRYGFKGSMPDTKNLILFALRHINEALTVNALRETIMLDDNFDYFVFSDAIEQMLISKHIAKNEEGKIYITQKGAEAGAIIERGLAVSLRRAAAEAAAETAERIRRENIIGAEVFEEEGGSFVRCSLTDGTALLAELTLYAGNKYQGLLLAGAWKKNAEKIYTSLMESFMKERK